jgi:urease accessory protein
MVFGGALGMLSVALPGVEFAIAVSIIVVGAALAAAQKWPLIAAIVVIALCGLVHGHAHGAEMPSLAAPWAYAIGFVAATAVLHAIGIAAGYFAVKQQGTATGLRAAGAAISAAGLLILLGAI